jgi:prepilin peptidase CpaA
MNSPPIVNQVLLAALALVAAVYDVRFRRIPNWLSLSGVLLGIGLNAFLAVDGLHWYEGYNWRSALGGLGLAFVIYFPLYLLRGMGAGDVKLMAAVGALVGPMNWIGIFVLSNVLGGITAVIIILTRGRFFKTFSNVGYMLLELMHFRPPYMRKEELDLNSPKAATMPHGVAIALGCGAFLVAAAIWAPK